MGGLGGVCCKNTVVETGKTHVKTARFDQPEKVMLETKKHGFLINVELGHRHRTQGVAVLVSRRVWVIGEEWIIWVMPF